MTGQTGGLRTPREGGQGQSGDARMREGIVYDRYAVCTRTAHSTFDQVVEDIFGFDVCEGP